MSRAQFATILWRMEDMPEAVYDANRFPDVPDGEFFTKPVMWASDKDVTLLQDMRTENLEQAMRLPGSRLQL